MGSWGVKSYENDDAADALTNVEWSDNSGKEISAWTTKNVKAALWDCHIGLKDNPPYEQQCIVGVVRKAIESGKCSNDTCKLSDETLDLAYKSADELSRNKEWLKLWRDPNAAFNELWNERKIIQEFISEREAAKHL